MKAKDLKPNPKNPRKITPEKLDQLKKALYEFGDLGGMVYNVRTKQMVGGHQRLKLLAADTQIVVEKKYSKPTRTGTVAEGFVELDGERHKYRAVDWDIHREMAANIAANKGAGTWDLPMLSEWILELDQQNFDLDLTMFSDKEREDLIVDPPSEAADGEDNVPGLPKVAKTKLGEIYELGLHRLMCGDSTSPGDVKCLMQKDMADLVFTDPPYGVDYDGGHAEPGKRREKLANDDSTLIYDNSVPLMEQFSKDNAALYLWFAATKSLQVLQVLQANNYEIRSWLIWNKNMAQFGAIGAQYKQKHEPCLYAYKKGNPPFWNGPNNEVSVWDVSRASKNEFHPTQKPVELAERAMRNSCPMDGLVMDLFGGSGSTIIAAEKMSRRARVMELDPCYCDVIVKRWEDFTGEKAKLIRRTTTKTRPAKSAGQAQNSVV